MDDLATRCEQVTGSALARLRNGQVLVFSEAGGGTAACRELSRALWRQEGISMCRTDAPGEWAVNHSVWCGAGVFPAEIWARIIEHLAAEAAGGPHPSADLLSVRLCCRELRDAAAGARHLVMRDRMCGATGRGVVTAATVGRALSVFAPAGGVEVLDITGCRHVTDEVIPLIVGLAPRLRTLRAKRASLSNLGVMELLRAPTPCLTTLSLEGPITDDALDRLGQTPSITALDVGGTGVTDDLFDALFELPALTELRLDRCSVTCSRMAVLSDILGRMRALSLEGCPYLSPGFERCIGMMHSMEVLRLDGADLQEPAALVHLSHLRELRLRHHATDALAEESLAKLTLLEILDLSGSPRLTDRGLLQMVTLPALRKIHLVGTGVTRAGMADFCLRSAADTGAETGASPLARGIFADGSLMSHLSLV